MKLQADKALQCIDLGLIAYQPALTLQENLHRCRKDERIGDTALFLEHTHVYTLGRRGDNSDILLNEAQIAARGIEIFQSNRGGQVTYHGPGQLVVYLIVNLYNAQRELRLFVETLEQSLISWLKNFGIQAGIDPAHPGVWVGEQKIAALGITVKEKVTMHGLALNITTDLSLFAGIIPCGIKDRGVTSLAQLIETPPSMASVKEGIANELARNFGYAGFRWVALPSNCSD